MTPCEEEGYKVGDRFLVTDGGPMFTDGSCVELEEDDGSDWPMFKLIEGHCRYTNAEGGVPGAYLSLESVTKLLNYNLNFKQENE